jgi:hypothetical protein
MRKQNLIYKRKERKENEMKSSSIGIKEGLDREVPDQKEYPFREVNREMREQLIKDMENDTFIIPEDFTPSINAYIVEHIKTGQRTSNYKKGFTVVDAIVNGKKKLVTFASKSLAYKVMNYIKETYENVDITFEITQM